MVLAVALALGLAGRAAADDLAVGDTAPRLQVKEFVKGEKVAKFEKGKVYVVEFWATWCGPCKATIPHLTELQKKYPDVVFIGVSVFERDQAKVKPFVKEMGEKMDYRVAMDLVPGDDPEEGKMARTWMIAAGQEGIPTAFIVNQDGKIAWIGHPIKMEQPLAQIVAGTWDLQVAANKFKKAKELKEKLDDLFEKVQEAWEAKDYKKVVSIIDKAIKDDADLEEELGLIKFKALVKLGDADKILEYGKRLADKIYKDDANNLNDMAWELVEKPAKDVDPRLMKFALTIAIRADKLSEGKSGAIADTVALAYYRNGDAAKALENQKRAMKLIKGTPEEEDPGFKERLEMYEKAVKGKAKEPVKD
jgi:thiol-disulfide isomerase/thioredoxin